MRPASSIVRFASGFMKEHLGRQPQELARQSNQQLTGSFIVRTAGPVSGIA
jgi:hypothetical protein